MYKIKGRKRNESIRGDGAVRHPVSNDRCAGSSAEKSDSKNTVGRRASADGIFLYNMIEYAFPLSGLVHNL